MENRLPASPGTSNSFVMQNYDPPAMQGLTHGMMNGMMNGIMNGSRTDAFYDLDARIQAFRRSDQERDSLLQDIVRQFEQLKVAHSEKCTDFENEVHARRRWQQQTQVLEYEVKAIRQRAESSSFILAIIDGDGAIFHDALLKAGSEGGSDAAHKLHTEIRKHVEELHDGPKPWSIVVHIYANLEGLGRKLTQVGIIKSPLELHTFARAFSLNQPLFNFIDVGSGKERADHKVKEHFRLFVSNFQCKHIVFGGCHDNGYLPNLDSYKHDKETAARITLLETTPIQLGFKALNFTTVQFSSVFRTDPLPEKATPPPMAPPVQAPVQVPIQPPAAPVVASPVTSNRSMTPVTTTPSATAGAQSSWASVGKAGAVEKTISIAPKKPLQRPHVLLNAYDQRIDPPLPKVERGALERFHATIKKQKYCNEYHLRGQCSLGSTCPYAHGAKLNQTDKLALQHKARNIPCSFLHDCRDVTCYYGHNCPYEDCTRYENCFFANTHGVDKQPRMKQYEDGTIDILG
ncbi:hypothetical protein K490DRAFT_61004 [Saccharata proteae CBS 121410]|uniref:C3H1-type domain-containing protein n=1 Tax=Saccharata proteae CBS 121410 TaxID=1314787 RepID=A0A9P4I208_9PEZI|nr:hypothetical protein K490DRAFT_61004 [Saccharata proteae CBS 121410]